MCASTLTGMHAQASNSFSAYLWPVDFTLEEAKAVVEPMNMEVDILRVGVWRVWKLGEESGLVTFSAGRSTLMPAASRPVTRHDGAVHRMHCAPMLTRLYNSLNTPPD